MVKNIYYESIYALVYKNKKNYQMTKRYRQILDCTKNKIYYKSTIIKWRGSSVG